MKTTLKQVFLIVLLTISTLSIAQPHGGMGTPPPNKKGNHAEKKQNIEAMKIAFITQKLDLTPEEAQQFWPVYNQYNDKLQELRKKRKAEFKENKDNFETLSDKEVEQIVDSEITFKQKEIDLQKEYHAKYKAVLPIKKVAKLYHAEEQFKRVLLEKLKDK
ncbi:MAG: hypothetical protein J0L87_07595 [Bacteroidetes bacterium]|nr:hypothetical protein [Bacteroidota bacterium]